MHLYETSTEYVLVPVTGPQPDLTIYAADIAIIPEAAGEPGGADWVPAAWIGGEAARLITSGDLAPGDYVVYARLTAGSERPVMQAGRLRVGAAV